jgi:hypothetical protein
LVASCAAVAVLAGIVLWVMALVSHGWRAEEDRQRAHTVVDLRLATESIEEFRQLQGRLPRSLKEVQEESFVDAWGHALVFQPQNAEDFVLFSKGPDGIAGTSDDIFLPESSARTAPVQNRGTR